MIKRTAGSVLLTVGAPLVLLLALIYSQLGWRADRAQYFILREAHLTLREKGTFPQDGQTLSTNTMRVVVDGDTVPLYSLVSDHGGVIYFERSDCPICARFGELMDSIMPSWRDSLVSVSPFDDPSPPG
jgi:hypothetical protein